MANPEITNNDYSQVEVFSPIYQETGALLTFAGAGTVADGTVLGESAVVVGSVTPDAGNTPIYYGGPVHMNEIFILHGPPFEWESSIMVTSTLAMSNTRDILEAVAAQKGPSNYLITLGCSGWGPDQMESEIKQNVWLSCPVDGDIIFDKEMEERWEAAVKILGINPALLTETAGHA